MTTTALVRSAICLLAVALVLVATGEAMAQQITAPSPGEIEASSPLPAYIVGLLLAGGALALTLMPSKRSHDD